MPSIAYDTLAAWSNYHLSVGDSADGTTLPQLRVRDLGRFYAADLAGDDGLARFAATGAKLSEHVARVLALANAPFPGPPVSPELGMVGRGWSFSALIGSRYSQLLCDGLAGTGTLADGDRNPNCRTPARCIALTSGGTRLRELVNWAKPRGLTVETSGTHLGPSIAGGFATASHGSKIGFGGLQNAVLGMHLIVGHGEHVWIEPSASPLLSDTALEKLAIGGIPPRLVRCDRRFADALVHLGAMGLVNGVALRLVEDRLYAPLRAKHAIDPGFLARIDAGDFGGIARRIGCESWPAFYELTIDPHAPFAEAALHNLYFATGAARTGDGCHKGHCAGEFIARCAAGYDPTNGLGQRPAAGAECADPADAALRAILDGATSAFARYAADGHFQEFHGGFDPDGPDVPKFHWDELHPDEITGGFAGALYNASFAIPRELTSKAIPALAKAVEGLPASFVFTLRFVSQPAGTLAFTRFAENTVIEIDGLSPLVCELFAQAAESPEAPPDMPDAAAFRALKPVLPDGVAAVRGALDRAGIPHSMHWGKLGDLDRVKVAADFGQVGCDGLSPLGRWQATREDLLPESSRGLFRNAHIIALGLV
ncbi:MAG: hypothetical protein IE933_05350 [Sphingomonadales bacterium]|nr:hypothetical protein [Sphingomonadales bacterium]MBD3772854.1 hypothetical protein [Paracoccaceae bacterium]